MVGSFAPVATGQYVKVQLNNSSGYLSLAEVQVYGTPASSTPPGSPTISSVSPILPLATQTITITGTGFGTLAPYQGDSAYIQIKDLTAGWSAGLGSATVTLNITQWTDTQITIQGFLGAYGQFGYVLSPGDQIQVAVSNAQSGAGPAYATASVTSPSSVPTIISVSPILPMATQTITIIGSGFGSQAPYQGDSPYIEISDLTGNWNAGLSNSTGANTVTLNVSQWTDTQITIQGFLGAYGQFGYVLNPGDQIQLGVSNAQTGAGPTTAAVSVTSTSTPTGLSVLPQMAFGGGWYSALYFSNLSGAAVSFPVNFINDAGTPLAVPSVGGSVKQVSLPAYGTVIIEAPNAGNLVEGYAEFTLPSGVYGYGVFRQSVPGQPDQEAVVPFSQANATSNTLTWDDTSYTTAAAIVNPGSTAATVVVELWDVNGNTIGTSSIPLPPGGKTEAVLKNLPGLSAMNGARGTAQFTVSSGGVAVLGLRFNGTAFTSIPTTTGASQSNSGLSVLPQLAFGGGWYSALYFSNLSGTAVSFPVNFVSDSGTPLTMPAFGGSVRTVNLPAYGTVVIEAPNVGNLVEGYAEFALPSGVYGYGVFRQSVPGQPDQEAVVPFSKANATSNTLTWDDTNYTTAAAIVNPSSTAATVVVELWDVNGNTIGTSTIPLPPGAKTETVLRNLPGLSAMYGARGTAQFSVSSGGVAVLGLRFNGTAFTSIPTTTGVQ
jgi:hypothetical protein